MSRKTKSDHQFELHIARTNSGYTTAEWSSPANRERSMREVGHLMMPADAYREKLMHRGLSSRDRRGVAVERRQARRAR